MEIQRNVSGENYELIVSGRIDGAGANQLETEIISVMKSKPEAIYINLLQSDYICSAGIRVLMQYFRQMKNLKKTFFVTRPSAEIDQILEMTGFKSMIVEANPK